MKLSDLLTGDNLGKVIAVLVVLSGGSDLIQTKMTENRIESSEGNLLRIMYDLEKQAAAVGEHNAKMIVTIQEKLGIPPSPLVPATPSPTPH